jgi:chromosomal replication initiation ATPase DnaA
MSFYLDKYCIEKKNDIQGNIIFIKEFKNWLNNNRNILFCIGDNGIGRTSICELLMKENNYDIYHYCDISYDKNVNEHIKNYFQNTSIKNYFKKEKKVLFIDDLDTYKSNIFKNILNIYNQFINNKILIKIICVIHKNNFNKFKEYTNNKIIDIIWFNKPTYNQVYKYIINIIDNENIELQRFIR